MDERLRRHILEQIRTHKEKIDALQLLLIENEKERNLELRFEGDSNRKSLQPKQGSIMEGVLQVLKSEPDGLLATEILSRLQSGNFENLVRTSLSPQLSRLKDRGYLEYVNRRWRIKPEMTLWEASM